MTIIPLPAFRDNYIWLLRAGTCAVVVDPGEAAPVLRYLADEGLTLAAILITHHHPDHVGGVAELLAQAPVPVHGPALEAIAGIDHPVGEGDVVCLPGLGVELRVFDIPGHTAGHVGYYGDSALFCGDTLFAAGCGRLFEGTPAQMFDSLQKLAALPGDTRVYCTHEYTLSNLAFAASEAMRAQNQPTVPFPLSGEMLTNPFLRVHEPAVIYQAETQAGRGLASPVEVFAALREWKNRF